MPLTKAVALALMVFVLSIRTLDGWHPVWSGILAMVLVVLLDELFWKVTQWLERRMALTDIKRNDYVDTH